MPRPVTHPRHADHIALALTGKYGGERGRTQDEEPVMAGSYALVERRVWVFWPYGLAARMVG